VIRPAAFLCGLLLAAAPAAAQDTDSQMMRNLGDGVPSGVAAAARFVSGLAECSARDQLSRARDTLRRLPASDASDKNLFWIAMLGNGCVANNDRLRYSVRYLRGPVAEYLLKRDFDIVTWKAKGKPAKVYTTPSNDKLDGLTADTRSAVIFTEVGNCVVTAAPGAATTLFQSARDSADEKAAFAALSPTLAGCIPPKVELRMSKFQLRGYLAEAAYRHAVSAPASEAAR
jgi:hypothetical protein